VTAHATAPEQEIRSVLNLGIAAITATPALIDDILPSLAADDLASCKAYWGTNPLTILSGFARSEGPFPLCAVTLAVESIVEDYVGIGEHHYLDGEARSGNEFKRRVSGTYSLHIYAEHPDVTQWYYRIVRRILNVAIPRFIKKGLMDPTLQGAELQPDSRYAPDQVFTRRLNLTLEYEEVWTDRDSLWAALNVTQEALTEAGSINVHHIDSAGSVTPS
jgi:hypothetical protein